MAVALVRDLVGAYRRRYGPAWTGKELFENFSDTKDYMGIIFPIAISAVGTSLMALVSAKAAGDPNLSLRRSARRHPGIVIAVAASLRRPCAPPTDRCLCYPRGGGMGDSEKRFNLVGSIAASTSIPCFGFDSPLSHTRGHVVICLSRPLRPGCSSPKTEMLSWFAPVPSRPGSESDVRSGDAYPVRESMIADGIGTMITSLFGSPFGTVMYFGHPAYKRSGAKTGYRWDIGVLPVRVRCPRRMPPLVASCEILMAASIRTPRHTMHNIHILCGSRMINMLRSSELALDHR